MVGPRNDTVQGSTWEPLKVAVTTKETTTSACSLLTTYNKSIHTGEKAYQWAQAEGALRGLKVWEAAATTAAAPLFFPARLLGESGTRYQDGLDTPLPQASSEGRKIWPHKHRPDYILSVGCGILDAKRNVKTSWLYRLIHLALTAWDSHQQCANFRLVTGEDDHCHRIDPILNMDEVRLDNAEEIKSMEQRVESALKHDLSLNAQIDGLALTMLSSLFYFEFAELPRVTTSGIECLGFICCRYNHDKAIMNKLWSNYFHELVFSVNRRSYNYNECNEIRFMVSHWSDMVDINLESRNEISPISGFPEKVDHLVSLQEACNIMPSAGSKRKPPIDISFHSHKRQRTQIAKRTIQRKIKRLWDPIGAQATTAIKARLF
ncbi:hypothetical protein IFR05_009424 [Cadophora sp. M221]|nr:hypothetical protein IFR05_009424 [Cadophora sp. M221]